MMRSLKKVSIVVLGMGLFLSSNVLAYELTGQDWTYKPNPMGEDWRVCATGMPGSGSQRTKDGAAAWNYSKFTFTFGTDACLSGGVYPKSNDVNQVDFGGGLGAGVLAETTWFFIGKDILECDMRFSNAFSWYTGTGTPSSTQIDWWSVAAHEMGHCLGLGHEPDITNPKPVMYPSIAPGEARRTLTADDIAGRNSIYGTEGGKSGGSVSIHVLDENTRALLNQVKQLAGQGQSFDEVVQTQFSLHTFRRLPIGSDQGGPTAITGGRATLRSPRPGTLISSR